MLKWLIDKLPWNRPTLADLPPEERRRARLLMWSAGASLRPNPGEDHIKVIVKNEDSEELE